MDEGLQLLVGGSQFPGALGDGLFELTGPVSQLLFGHAQGFLRLLALGDVV